MLYICLGGWPTISHEHLLKDDNGERFVNGIDENTPRGWWH